MMAAINLVNLAWMSLVHWNGGPNEQRDTGIMRLRASGGQAHWHWRDRSIMRLRAN